MKLNHQGGKVIFIVQKGTSVAQGQKWDGEKDGLQ